MTSRSDSFAFIVGLLLVAALVAVAARPAYAAEPPQVGFLFGRAQAVETERGTCNPASGAVGILGAAARLGWRSDAAGAALYGSAIVIPSRVGGPRVCSWLALYTTGWDLDQLRDANGWRHVSYGATYSTMAGLTPTEQRAEACGAVDQLGARGHDPTGLFAPPADGDPTTADLDGHSLPAIYGCGFQWTRDYGAETWRYSPFFPGTKVRQWTNVRSNMHPGGFLRVVSVNGGSCPDGALCSTSGERRRYLDSDELLRHVGGPGTATFFQVYRLVEGRTPRWDCTGPPGSRWTWHAETLCAVTLTEVADGLRAKGAHVTDPGRLAQAWGVSR